MKAMILAAGFGTRFRPLTHEIPKPMLPLCNRPLIAYAVDALLDAGIREFVVNLHHLPEPIESYLTATFGARCAFEFSREEEILGTGGGVRRVRKLLEKEPAFFIVNGDTIQWPPVGEALRRVEKERAIAAMVLRHPPAGDRYTGVYAEGGRVTGIGEGRGEAMMFSGAHALSSRVFDYIPDREFSGITEDVYIPLLRSGSEQIAAVIHDALWFDIGTPLRYMDATHVLRRAMLEGSIQVPAGTSPERESASLRDEDAIASAATIESVLGPGCRIASGAEVTRSVLLEGVSVEESAVIRDSLVANGVRIPARMSLDRQFVCRVRDGIDYGPAAKIVGDLVLLPLTP